MRRLIAIAALIASLAEVPGLTSAEVTIADEPAVRGWALLQEGPAVTFEKDVLRGDVIPDGIKLAEVPNYPQYGFVILNTERLIVDAQTRKVIAVY